MNPVSDQPSSEISVADRHVEQTALLIAELHGGGFCFGVDARHLLQVVPVPGGWPSVPRSGSSIAGILDFRSRAVPVVDLRHWQGESASDDSQTSATPGAGRTPAGLTPNSEAAGSRVAVLSHGEQWVGVLIQRTGELLRTAPSGIQKLHHDDDPNEFFHTVVKQGNGDQWLPLIDAGRLMRRAKVWSGQEVEKTDSLVCHDGGDHHAEGEAAAPESAQQQAFGQTVATPSMGVAVIGVGDRLYGFDVRDVVAVLHRPALQPVRADGTDLLGFLEWRGQKVPVLHPARLMEDGSQAVQADAAWVLVLRGEDEDEASNIRWLALTCHRIDQVRQVRLAAMEPSAALGKDVPQACAKFFYIDGSRVVRVMSSQALLLSHGMPASGVGTGASFERDQNQGNGRTSHPNTGAYVAFHAGRPMAVPIETLHEILPHPSAEARGGGETSSEAGSAEPGTMLWRGRQIPLRDMSAPQSVGEESTSQSTANRVLVTKLGDHVVGLLVGEVDLLIPAYTAEISRTRLPGGEALAFITTRHNGKNDSRHLLDLDRMAAELA